MTRTLPTQQSMRIKKKKTKRKLRKLTSIMPMLEWRPDIEQVHMFHMPLKYEGIKDLQIHTPIKSRKKKVWAHVFQKLCKLPTEIYMKDIEFGFIPYHNNMGWNVDEHKIVWVNQQVKVPHNEIRSLTLRGTAITYTEWTKVYNPYVKYSKFIIDVLRNNKRLQTSLPNTMNKYRSNGKWNEICEIRNSIWDITSSCTLYNMGEILGNKRYYFIIPNPISATSINLLNATSEPCFNLLINKNHTEKQSFKNYISNTIKEEDNPF